MFSIFPIGLIYDFWSDNSSYSSVGLFADTGTELSLFTLSCRFNMSLSKSLSVSIGLRFSF